MITVAAYGNKWNVVAEFGKIQPQAVVWSKDVFYIASSNSHKIDAEAKLFADNLPRPKLISLHLELATVKRKMTQTDLDKFDQV